MTLISSQISPDFQLTQLPILKDNYCYLITHLPSRQALVIDPGCAQTIRDWLNAHQIELTDILQTHHHPDHTGGTAQLRQDYPNVRCYAGQLDQHRIPADNYLNDQDKLQWHGTEIQIMETLGHTTGHISYYIPFLKLLFCADTLFNLGCGRRFEGTAAQFWQSLSDIRALPADTKICCAHEYTLANLDFVESLMPETAEFHIFAMQMRKLREQSQPTVPTILSDQIKFNPFLRADQPDVQLALNMVGHAAPDVFAELRRRKDQF